ncbi:MAG: GSCFA domain-containing protein [Bacteroidales bacterium]|nr:GSCFA domain-containing protein [Bacteroidales bacterium]
MKWQTKVNISSLEEKMLYSNKSLFLGSCFASEVGNLMKEMRFQTEVNPFGVMYNPASIALGLNRLDSCTLFTEKEIFASNNIYKSFYHGSEFASDSKENFLLFNNQVLKRVSDHFHNSKFIVITLGTSWVFKEKSTKQVVSNCHKLSPSNFERSSLSIDQIVSLLSPFIKKYRDKQWIFTVSPVRHLKDGAHGNQISKSKLLLATDILENSFSNLFYFPAYELFMDELRDYRFYASDMVHPANHSVKYVWERFKEFAIDPACETKIKMVESLNQMYNHKPLFPKSNEYSEFIKKREQLEEKLSKLEL